MRKGLKKTLKVGGVAAGGLVILLVVTVLLVLFDKPLIRKISRSYIAKKTGLPIQIGGLDYTFFPLHVTLREVKTTYKTSIFTMAVVIDRLEAAGNLKKLLNGTKPAFDKIDVEIAELRFAQEKFSPIPIDFAGILQQTSVILAYARQVSMSCGRMSVALPGQNFAFDNLSLALSKAPAAGVYDLRLASEKAAAGMNDGSLSLESPLRVDGTLTLARQAAANLQLVLSDNRLVAAGRVETFKDLALEIDGGWDTSKNSVGVAKLKFDVPGLIVVSASGSAGLNKPISLEVSGDVLFEDLGSLVVMLGPSLPSNLGDLRLHGGSRLWGQYALSLGPDSIAGNLDASLELDRFALEYDKAGSPLKLGLSGILKAAVSSANAKGAPGRFGPLKARLDSDRLAADYDGPGLPLKLGLSGMMKAEGTPSDFRASADIRSTLGAVTRDNLSVRSSSIRLLAEGTKKSADISRFEAALEDVSLALPDDQRLSFDVVKANGAGRADIAGKSIVVSALEVGLPALPPLHLSGRFHALPGGLRQAHLETRGLKIPAVRGLLSPFLPPSLADWEADGSVDIVLDFRNRFNPTAGWEFSGGIDLSAVKFNDALFTVAGDSLSPRIRVQGDYELSTRGLDCLVTLELSQGESLWKDFYISWSRHPLKADLAGRYDPAAGALEGLSTTFVFPTIGEVRIKGKARLLPSPSFDLHAAAKFGLEPLYSLYSQSGVPPESRLRLSGDVSADLAVGRVKGETTVNGRVTLEASEIENPAAKMSVRDFRAELPVRLKLGGVPVAGQGEVPSAGRALPFPGLAERDDTGYLRVLEIRTPSLSLRPPRLDIQAGINAWRVEPFTWELFGGPFEVGEMRLTVDPAAGTFRGSTSLRLSEIGLAGLPLATAEFPLTGTARFHFPRLDLSPTEVRTEGRAEIDIFGGRVVVSDLAVSDPLAKGRKISGDVELRNLDLKKITDIVPFGEITGIIRGEVRGLTISYGQPECFTLILESVPRKGVAQTFSLKAVDNLTVLSSGQQASAGAGRFFMRFVRGFRYAKIGIVSTLKNDTFTLNGTIRENGVEYLVKKPALFGINVINRMPDKKISFKEMMSRLRRVGQTETPAGTR